MKASSVIAIVFCFAALSVVAAQPNVQYSRGGLPGLPSISGELEKLPKEVASDQYACGKNYFAGRDDDDPDSMVTFALKDKVSVVDGKTRVLKVMFAMTKKNISVIPNDLRRVPFATVRIVDGRKKVELQVPTSIIMTATCLPKSKRSKGA